LNPNKCFVFFFHKLIINNFNILKTKVSYLLTVYWYNQQILTLMIVNMLLNFCSDLNTIEITKGEHNTIHREQMLWFLLIKNINK